MIRHLIFDVDGTLWDSTPIVSRAWNMAMEEVGYKGTVFTPDLLRREFGLPMDVIANDVFGNVPDLRERNALMERCCAYEHKVLETNREDITFPGMRAGMERLAKQYKLYIVSNCQSGYIELVMRKTGIGHLIRDFACFGDTGTCKGETMKLLLQRNGIGKGEAVYVGDTKGDLEAAEMAGVPFIFAAYGFGKVERAAARVYAFEELEGAVKKLNAGGA